MFVLPRFARVQYLQFWNVNAVCGAAFMPVTIHAMRMHATAEHVCALWCGCHPFGLYVHCACMSKHPCFFGTHVQVQ